jgi:hypothetical protein
MNIYLAARYSRYPEMQKIRAEVEALGKYKVISRWINGEHSIEAHSYPTEDKYIEERAKLAAEDLEDLEAAQRVICFTEGPDTQYARGGRHVEFGYALCEAKHLGKDIIVVGHRENVFYCLPHILFCRTWEEAKEHLR